jgi:hypothetical protein
MFPSLSCVLRLGVSYSLTGPHVSRPNTASTLAWPGLPACLPARQLARSCPGVVSHCYIPIQQNKARR